MSSSSSSSSVSSSPSPVPAPFSTVPYKFPKDSAKKVGVIGGGWSGLYALKSFLEVGLDAVLFESTETIGGVWVYHEDKPGGVFLNTRTTASKSYLHASDFPFPDEVGHFPFHEDCLKFLNDYADHFKLRDRMRMRCNVHKVRKTKDGTNRWKVVLYSRDAGDAKDDEKATAHGAKIGKKEIHFFDIIAACGGQHQVPFYPEEEPYRHFTGETMHAHSYKYPTEAMKGKSVVVVGGGESASDVAAEVCEFAKTTYLSIRQGVWFQDRTVGAHQPADMVFTKHQRLLGFSDYQSWLVWIGRYMMLELMWGKGGSGVKDWQPACPYFQGFLNKSRDVVDKVALGKVQPRSGVVKIEGKKIWFKNRSEPDEVDLIIFATGYRANVLFLKPGQSYTSSYKLVFDPDDPTLCHIGSARPMIGSIPGLGELQARWAAAVYSGQYSLPSTPEMRERMKLDHMEHKRVFFQDDRSLPQLVNHWAYSDEIASYFGAKPNLLKWFFRSPTRWWTIISAPWSAFIYRVEDPKTRDQAIKNIEKTWLPDHYPFRAFNYTMLVIDVFLALLILVIFLFLLCVIFC